MPCLLTGIETWGILVAASVLPEGLSMRFLTLPVTLMFLIVSVYAQQFRVGKDFSPDLIFTNIDHPNAQFQGCIGINNNGDIVGFWSTNGSRNEGFLYSNGSFTDFDNPDSGGLWGTGINDAGTIAGTAWFQTGKIGFTLTNGHYHRVSYPGYPETAVNGINRQGDVVGEFEHSGQTRTHGFLRHDGGYTLVEYPGAISSTVRGINSKGAMIGAFALSFNEGHGFLLENGSYTFIDFPGTIISSPWGINDAGVIVGNYTLNSEYGGYVLENGVFHKVLVPGAIFTYLFGINNQNVVVGRYEDSNLTWHGFTAHK